MLHAGPIAHAQWFVDSDRAYPIEWGSLGSTSTLVAVGVTALICVVVLALSRSLPAAALVPSERLGRLAYAAPRLIGVALGLGLIGLSALGSVWVPSQPAADVPLGVALGGVQAALGAWLVLGFAPEKAALGVMAYTALAAVAIGPLVVLQAAYVPALAMALLASTGAATARSRASAATSLRFGMGVGLIAVAMTEKLAAPAITETVLQTNPDLNVLAVAGIGAGPETFTLAAGCIEIFLGFLLLAGVAPQIVAVSVLVPFVATLPLFGATELIGHLPIYGTLIALAVLTPASVAGARAPASMLTPQRLGAT